MLYGQIPASNQKRILILGAGNAQIDLIERCKAMGLEVHGISYNASDPGIPLLDHFEQINILDVDGVEAYICTHDISYVYSIGSDIAVPTCSEAAKRTGLRSFISPETAQLCCNKHLMRSALCGSPYQIRYAICCELSDAKQIDFYPVMMKPVDSQGQRGIYVCYSQADVEASFEQSMAHSRSGMLILEQYIPGEEVSFNGYMLEGTLVFGILSDRKTFREYPGIVKGHCIPSSFSGTDVEAKVTALVNEAVQQLNIRNGPIYFQIMIHQDWPYLIEVTPRLDGCHMWQLIQLYTGVDLLDMTLKHLVKGVASWPQWIPLLHSARTVFDCRKPGAVFAPDLYTDLPACGRDYYQHGDIVKRMNGCMEKCGYRMYVQRKRVALIGGSGLIGKCFHHMYAADFELLDVSRSTGAVSDYCRHDLSCALKGCDAAVILAAKRMSGEEEDYSVNIRIAEEALLACHAAGIKQVIFLSSRCVYDISEQPPYTEEASIRPINAYGKSKYAAEQVVRTLAARYDIRACVLRIAQVLNAEDRHTAFHTFLMQALNGEHLIVYGGGSAKRDYIDVRDVCHAIRRSLHATEASGVYNIGSGRPTTVAELAMAVMQAVNTNAQVIFSPEKSEDGNISFLQVDKARTEIGFQAKYTLSESVAYGVRCLLKDGKERQMHEQCE